ncbi:hypothetical protein Sango_0435200 [Sesamum angolense]|uniref:Uncharacterized protein n=1 Tax=Sesamum angolense TaxID=2727404 RepID=A0AAE2C4A3_9LAMI|nr:hypothetical protein Sango_0435200 [Sesamum angolense]
MRSVLKNRTAVSSNARAPSAEASENVRELASPCCTSKEGSCFKENININKSETPKLTLEPLQMKRKKKGAGYNLRKSLAWDRAFFTEEGVLDPLELSVITGASCREALPFTDEDTPGGSQVPIKRKDVQNLKNNLLNKLQTKDFDKDQKKDWSSPKFDSSSSNFMASTFLTSDKVPTGLGSKSRPGCADCPRPLPPSSYPLIIMLRKELKLPKVPGLKSDISPICATTKSTIPRVNYVNYNQITEPGFNDQSNEGSMSSYKSLKNTQNASKASSVRPTLYSDGNSGKSSSRRYSSVNMHSLLVDKANHSVSKMIPDNMTPVRLVNSSQSQHEPTTSVTPFSQNAHLSCRTMHTSQNQNIKPSGLRMPSPSLSFFGQPKSSVFRKLSLRDTDFSRSQRPGSSILLDNLRRTPKTHNKVPESIICSSKTISSRMECLVSSHGTAVDLIKPELEGNHMQKIQDIRKKHGSKRISHEEADMQKIDIEMPSKSGSCEQVMDGSSIKKAVDCYPGKSESCGSGCRNPQLMSEKSYSILESKTCSNDDPPKEKKRSHSLVLNHDAINGTKCENALDHRQQNSLTMPSDGEESSKPDCQEFHGEQTDPFNYSLGEIDRRTDKDNNVLKTKQRASDQLGVSQLNESRCSRSASTEALEPSRAEDENAYFRSKHLPADPSKEAAFIEVPADNLLVGLNHIQVAACASTIGSCKNDVNLISEVDDHGEQSEKCLVVQNISLNVEMELQRNVENTSDRLLCEKQICCKKSQQGKNDEKLLLEVPDRKDENRAMDAKMASSVSPGKMHDSNFGEEKLLEQPLISTELDSMDNLLSSESDNNLINMTFNPDGGQKGYASVLMNGPSNESLSNSLHDETWRAEITSCSSFPESGTHEVLQKNTLGKVTMAGPIIQVGSANNWFSSTMSLKESKSDIDNLRNIRDSVTVLVQSPVSNTLNKSCFTQSECLALPIAEFVIENTVGSNEGLQSENYLQNKSLADVSYEDNALGTKEDSGTGQMGIYSSISRSSSISSQDSVLEHESCNSAYGTEGRSHGADAITDPSKLETFSDVTKSEVFYDTNISSNCLPPKLDQGIVKAASPPNNKDEDGLKEKSFSLILPQNAIPFSDEWLAAIEAAGEDILTRKSGAVQNSPPDKSLPEPSPWSPVKRKNNQIGPFDCTKFTNILPSDSS